MSSASEKKTIDGKKKEFLKILLDPKQGMNPAIQAIKIYIHKESLKQKDLFILEDKIKALEKWKQENIHDEDYIKKEINKIQTETFSIIMGIKEADIQPPKFKKKKFEKILVDPKKGIKTTIKVLQNIIYKDTPKQTILIILDSRNRRIEQERLQRIHKEDYIQSEKNKLTVDLLSFINDLDSNDIDPDVNIDKIIDEISKTDVQPSSPKKSFPNYFNYKTSIPVGAILGILFYITGIHSIFAPEPFIFEIQGESRTFQSNDTIVVTQKKGEKLAEIYVRVDNSASYYDIDTACKCWKIGLIKYRLADGKYEIKIAKDQLGFEDLKEHTINEITIDNVLDPGVLKSTSKIENDSTLIEVRGKAKEKVSVELALPISEDSTLSSFEIYKKNGIFYFVRKISFPFKLFEQYKDEIVKITVRDGASNEKEVLLYFSDLLNDNRSKEFSFGSNEEYKLQAEAFEDFELIKETPPKSPRHLEYDPKVKPESLSLDVMVISPEIIGLKWKLKTPSINDVEYTLYKRSYTIGYENKDSTFKKVIYHNSKFTSFQDYNVEPGLTYDYYVEAKLTDNDTIRSLSKAVTVFRTENKHKTQEINGGAIQDSDSKLETNYIYSYFLDAIVSIFLILWLTSVFIFFWFIFPRSLGK